MLSPRHHAVSRPLSVLAALAALAAAFAACGGSSRTAAPVPEPPTTLHPELQRVEYGRLVDVLGLQVSAEGTTIVPYRRDVVIGGNIVDERKANQNLRDDEIRYDFLSADPDTLQPQLLITRDVTSAQFLELFEALDDEVREVEPMVFGGGGFGQPFPVVPRNGAIRLTFSADLGVDEDFFVVRNSAGTVIGQRNTEAVQVLELAGDPTQPGGFVPLTTRVIPGQRTLTIDSVLLGSEGLQYQTRNNASGLPASLNQAGANIRIALALEGPLALPGLRENDNGDLTGLNNSAVRSVVRDFRSGNANDTSADLSRGYVRDDLPLRMLGEIVMYLERVERINSTTQEITVFKNGASHEIDQGDVFRLIADNSGQLFATTSVVADPVDDRGAPSVQHVRVRVRNVQNLESIDPSNLPGYPTNAQEREPWLVQNAPRAICAAEFRAGGVNGGDDPRNFLTFTPRPLPNLDGSAVGATEFVSPLAGAVVRFTKPVDLSTVRWADTFFFAMRDLVSQDEIDEFIATRPNPTGVGMDPEDFKVEKYRTPYLIASRVVDEDGSQTALRLQPRDGFFLDDTMRNPPAGADYRYFLHLIADSRNEGGIRDLAGNALDLQAETTELRDHVVIDFTVDTRMNGSRPFAEDNLAVSVVRRYGGPDEDEQPSYFLANEVRAAGGGSTPQNQRVDDVIGSCVLVDGRLAARPTSRGRRVADDQNQLAPPPQSSTLRWCPGEIANDEVKQPEGTAGSVLLLPLQNPLNPWGSRVQTVWREVDLSLSKVDPLDFDLDVEQMYWAPATGSALYSDEFDRVALFLGHAEHRPEPCVGNFGSLPLMTESGLKTDFARNYVWNPRNVGTGTEIETQPSRFAAYGGANGSPLAMPIEASAVLSDPTGSNRYLPLPRFERPYFVFRDQRVVEQGGVSEVGQDTGSPGSVVPYILSPFLHGAGRGSFAPAGGGVVPFAAYWNNCVNFGLASGDRENFTGGLVGAIALPLLADFWVYCDSPALPAGNPFQAQGSNGWQVALAVQSSARPNFRAVSAGRPAVPGQPTPLCIGPGHPDWETARGGFEPLSSVRTASVDSTLYWIMIDFLKRQSVATAGFVDLYNPHRVPEGFEDPRLGPYYLQGGVSRLPNDVLLSLGHEFDPPLSALPGGTSIVAEFRGAGPVDPEPWYWNKWILAATPMCPVDPDPLPIPIPGFGSPAGPTRLALKPDASNFPLDPRKAGDAHIRKYDDRGGRNGWTGFYNRNITGYVEDPNELMNVAYTQRFAAVGETFGPRDVRYLNWRFVMSNNVDADPPIAPEIETFALSYTFERTR